MTNSVRPASTPDPLIVPASAEPVPGSSYEALAGLIDSLAGILNAQRQPLNCLDRVEIDILSRITKRILLRNGFPVDGAEPIFDGGICNTPGTYLTEREALYKCLLFYKDYIGNHRYIIERGWTILTNPEATDLEMSGQVTDIITFCQPTACRSN